ncbi:sensor histidine kinase [Gracilinema caldarium]|uniref:sensor histidine kinase n=1 Tax=Gracilinema caldarium TaxID=215591 RepID=UPI0026E9C890|nr:ABC transporter substrate binding protein [Gracilinema caldarium]
MTIPKGSLICMSLFLWTGMLLFGAEDPLKVLVLHSYQTDYPWTGAIQKGIETVLNENTTLNVIIKTEHVDTKRLWTEPRKVLFVRYLEEQYKAFKFDAVIVSDNDAYNFMLQYGDALFGQIPWVFCGVNNPDLTVLAPYRSHVTGVIEYVNYEKTLHLIQSLLPDLQTLFVLADETTTGIVNKGEFKSQMAALEQPIHYEILAPASFQHILNQVSRFPEHTAILLLAYSQDSSGTYIPYKKVVNSLSAAASVPVFGVWDFNMGQGILGGAITSGFEQGKQAAGMLIRILEGTEPQNIPLLHLKDTPLMIDWQQLQRWRLPKNRLPMGTIILNRAPNIIAENPHIGIIIVFLSCTIVILGIFIILLKRAQSTLRASQLTIKQELQEKEMLLREVHHRVKNNLQIMASLIHLQQSYTTNPETQSILLDTENRIRSMELVHEESYEQDNFKKVNLVQYICSLGSYLSSISSNEYTCTFECSPHENAQVLYVSLEWVVPFGLLMNELITNSIKYAHGEQGFCGIYGDIERIDEHVVRLTYWDSGPGIPKEYSFDKPETLGFQLMNVLAQQCNVRLLRDEKNLSKIYILITIDQIA